MDAERARQSVEHARRLLMLKHPWWGILALHLEPQPSRLPPFARAGTDGKRFLYDPATWNPEWGLFAWMHEVTHLGLGHLWRFKPKNQKLGWLASDYAGNGLLHLSGIPIPEGSAFDPEWAGKSFEECYFLLLREKKQGGGPHINVQRERECTWDEAAEGSETNERDLQDWDRYAARATAITRQWGKLPTSLERLISGERRLRLEWTADLKQFVLSAAERVEATWNPPNRRHLWRDMALPSLRGSHIELAVAVDTSGSIATPTLDTFAAVVRGILDQFQSWTLHLISADAAVQSFHTLKSEQGDRLPTRFPGGGGTDFAPAFREIESRRLTPAVLIYLTDLDGSFPDKAPAYPVVWATTTLATAPFGRIVRVPE